LAPTLSAASPRDALFTALIDPVTAPSVTPEEPPMTMSSTVVRAPNRSDAIERL
jgi:hypothetical protein